MNDDTSRPQRLSYIWHLAPWLAAVLLAIGVAWGIHHTVIPGITGWVNDDGVYVDLAQALRHGQGFVTTLTGMPQPGLRYPIMFPALLALASFGTHGITATVMRMQWVAPISAGLLSWLVFYYMRRIAGWRPLGALAAALLVGCNPITINDANLILSDASAAALGMLAIIAIEGVLRRDAPAWWRYAGCAALLVVLCLMRYEAATLVLASVLVLAQRRRFKGLTVLLGTFALAFMPWVLYRMHTGGEEYGTTLGFLADKPFGFLFKNLSAIAGTLLSKTLPSYVLPGWPDQHTLLLLLLGTLLSAVMLLGTLASVWRPHAGQSSLGALYLLISVALVLIWMVRYVTTAGFATERLLLPVAPFALQMFVRGAAEIRARYEGQQQSALKRLGAALVGLVVVFVSYRFVGYVASPQVLTTIHQEQQEYQATFDYIRADLPPNATLLCLKAPAVHLQTGRPCWDVAETISDRALIWVLARHHVDYLIGLPFIIEAPSWVSGVHGQLDASVLIVNDLTQRHPGLLKPVYFNDRGHIGIFKIDHAKLAAAAAQREP